MYAYTYRYSCYDCKFAQVPRQGDITLADFWGVDKFFAELDRTKGVSLILVNTQQGRVVRDAIKESIEYRKSNVVDAAKENGNLVQKTVMPEIRLHCYQMVRERGYEDVARKEFRIKGYRYYVIKSVIRTVLNYIKGY